MNNLQELIAYMKANQGKMQYSLGRRRLRHAPALRAVQLHARRQHHAWCPIAAKARRCRT